jgi:hypothetical protein
MKTIHVWQNSPLPTKPYGGKKIAALTIADGLAVAATGDQVIVHGDGKPRCRYKENVVVSVALASLNGEDWPIIDGGGNGRALELPPVGAQAPTILVRGFEIVNGKTGQNGAGIYAKDRAVVIAWNCIHDSHADDTGGGIGIEFTAEDKYIPCYVISNGIRNNTAVHGGGIGAKGVTLPSDGKRIPAIVFIHSNVIGPQNIAEKAKYVHGGGASIYRITASIAGNEIKENRVRLKEEKAEAYGAGVCVYNIDANSTWDQIKPGVYGIMDTLYDRYTPVQVYLKENFIHDNHAEFKGGGVSGLWGAMLIYETNLIKHNDADKAGGGVYATTHAQHLFLNNNAIVENRVTKNDPIDGRGGGIHASCRARLVFNGPNVVQDNRAENNGGGISLQNADLSSIATLLVAKNEAVNGMGGGIFSLSSPPGGPLISSTLYAPCDADNIVRLSECIIEENTAKKDGGGGAFIKDREAGHNMQAALPTTLWNCIVAKNKTDAEAAGIYLERTDEAAVSSDFLITGCLIEGHSADSKHAGVVDTDATVGRLGRTRIKKSTLRDNSRHAVLHNSSAEVEGNLFGHATVLQLSARGGKGRGLCQLGLNDFDGGGSTPRGVVADYPAAQPNLPQTDISISLNNIHDHSQFGVECTGARATAAERNWWGNNQGPTMPGGQVAGDKVSKDVETKPFLVSPDSSVKAPAIPTLTRPGSPNPTRPVAPDCSNLDKPPADQPGDPPHQGQDPPAGHGALPHGTHDGGYLAMLRRSLVLPDGSSVPAIILPNGAAVLLHEDGSLRGLLERTGKWHPRMDVLDVHSAPTRQG